MPSTTHAASLALIALALAGTCALARTPREERNDLAMSTLTARFATGNDSAGMGKALVEEAAWGHRDGFVWLLERGADCDQKDEKGRTALIALALELRPPPAGNVIPGTIEIPMPGQAERTSATEQMFGLAIACTKVLDATDKAGYAAIHYAALRRMDAVLRLARSGANINLRGADGSTVIMDADTSLLPALVKQGADINARDARGQTLLHRAFTRYETGTVLLQRVQAALALGARDLPDAQGRFASEMDARAPLGASLPAPQGAGDPFFGQVDRARALIRATR